MSFGRPSPRLVRSFLLLAGAVLLVAQAASAQLQWKSADEKMSFKIGILGQFQGESIDVANASGAVVDTSQNLFLRRGRILMSFTLGEKLSVFFETDNPNLGKATGTTGTAFTKDAGNIFVQDFVATYKFKQGFHLDGGMILPVLSYNHGQSAASLMPVDYGAYTFVEGAAMGARVGRDYGVQARGYFKKNAVEYRLGIFQGNRGVNAANDFRYVGRIMYSFFTPPVGLFYRGTSLGKTKTISIGASFDAQEKYSETTVDAFFDIPVGKNGFSGQIDWTTWDGDTFLTAIPKQDNLLVEAGYYIASAKIMPFVQYAAQNFDAATRIDETRTSIGFGYFINGHNNNIKFSYTKIDPKKGSSRDQFLVQWQIFQF